MTRKFARSQFPDMEHQAVASIRAHVSAGRLKQALAAARQFTQQCPTCAELWMVLSEVLEKRQAAVDALMAIQKAVPLEPTNSRYLAQLANCQLFAGEFAEAQLTAEKALRQNNLSALTLDKVGNVLNSCGELELAHRCFKRAVAQQPDVPHFLFNLATLQRAMGKLAEAEACFTRIIAIRPNDCAAYLARSSLRTLTPESNYIEELEARLAKTAPHSDGEIRLCYALAKECEDIGDYSRSFRYLQRGSDGRRKRMDYKVVDDVAAMDKIRAVFSAERLQQIQPGCVTDEPIFILGLPRTGTTLVERILSCHSEVFAAGELQNFAVELIKLVQRTFPGESMGRPALIEKSAQLDYGKLGQRYLDSTRPRTGKQPRFIDKLPLNYLYTGLIQRALPKTKIIHLTRNPMDACYAIYKTLFQQAYPFSYSLEDLGRYYIAYRQLMAHWQQVLGDNVLNVSYEGLVANQERVSRQMVEFCGLEWQEACLNFQNNTKPTATASASQVRRGLYSSSVEKWRCYSDQLAPLQAILRSANIDPHNW